MADNPGVIEGRSIKISPGTLLPPIVPNNIQALPPFMGLEPQSQNRFLSDLGAFFATEAQKTSLLKIILDTFGVVSPPKEIIKEKLLASQAELITAKTLFSEPLPIFSYRKALEEISFDKVLVGFQEKIKSTIADVMSFDFSFSQASTQASPNPAYNQLVSAHSLFSQPAHFITTTRWGLPQETVRQEYNKRQNTPRKQKSKAALLNRLTSLISKLFSSLKKSPLPAK